MEEMSLQDFVNVLFNAGVLDENQPGKWEDILNKLSLYYHDRAVEFYPKLPQTSKYYAEIADKLFTYLCDRNYYN